MKEDEAGITLVELLATLVLVTIVTAVIWNTVLISTKYTTVETKKLRLQQEANYVITEIQRYHRKCDRYTITIGKKKDESKDVSYVWIEECKKKEGEIEVDGLTDLKINNNFVYDALRIEEEEEDRFSESPIDTKVDDASLSFKLIVQDVERTALKVEIPTNISRYKSQGSE